MSGLPWFLGCDKGSLSKTKASPTPRRAQERAAENTTPRNPHPGGVTHPLGGAEGLSAGLARGPPRRPPASGAEPPRRTSDPQHRGFRQQRKPLRGAPEGLLRGPGPGLETRHRRRSHSSYRDTGVETDFGVGELTCVPGLRFTPDGFRLVCHDEDLLYSAGERATGFPRRRSPALRSQISAPPPAGRYPGGKPPPRSPHGGAHGRSPRPRRRSGDDHPDRRRAHG